MYQPVTSRRPRKLFLVLAVALVLFSIKGVASAPNVAPPQRLRLRVENNTLRSGDVTRIFVEFLDRDYQQVPSDGTRAIDLGQAPAGTQQNGSGSISPQHITVAAGAWHGEATFASRQPGRLFITARSEGLDSAQVLVLVTRPTASFLSQLFETVAYAEPLDGFAISPKIGEVPANDSSRATFQVSFLEAPAAETIVRISTSPLATVIYNGQKSDGIAEIKLAAGQGVSDYIGITSKEVARVDVLATVLKNGSKDHASVNFLAPRPSRIIFEDDPAGIPSYQSTIPISIELADAGGKPLEPDQEHHITLRSANQEDPVEFEPATVVLSSHQASAQSILHLKGLPMGNELRLLAVAQSGNNLRIGQKTIIIRSPVEKIMIIGPTEVTRDNTKADFTIRLLDKDGKYTIADWDRKIDLSATSGYFSQPQITIPRGQAEARVQYVSGASAGKAALKAESAGIAGGSMDITLATAPSWLVLAALVGGLVGGIVRQIHKDYKLERIMPRWNGECWELGLVGRIAGSVASGFFLYLTVKFGLLPMIGSPALPAALDLGTRTVALFFGGIGGFAGTVVFDRLVSWCLPAGKKEAAKAPAAPSAVS